VEEEVIVGAQDIKDLVAEVDDDAVDCVAVQSVGSSEPLVLPLRETLVHPLQELLFPTPKTHTTQLYYNHRSQPNQSLLQMPRQR
jgi:hypothetical protein